MTREDKQLLLKDLCARLPYGIKCNALLKQIDGSLKSIFGTFKGYNGWANIGNNLVDINTVLPYLRPMSSMTEEELKELKSILNYDGTCDCFLIALKVGKIIDINFALLVDWLNKKMFDYRGLIPKGLALEASEGMYK